MYRATCEFYCTDVDYDAVDEVVVISTMQPRACFNVNTLNDSEVEDVEQFHIDCTLEPARDRVSLEPDSTTIRIWDDEGNSYMYILPYFAILWKNI